MNCNGRRLVLFALLLAAIGLLWGFTAQATASHIIGPVGTSEGACDGTDNDGDGFIDDGFHDADMAFGGGDGIADCMDAGDADGDGLPDNKENPKGTWPPTASAGSTATNPEDPDSDDDGLLDGAEDSDHDGVAADIGVTETDPN
jgi:hypothetical protein